MRGFILPFPKYAFMAWCSVKAQAQLYLYFYFSNHFLIRHSENDPMKESKNDLNTYAIINEQVTAGRPLKDYFDSGF
jgi:hypothetical protein